MPTAHGFRQGHPGGVHLRRESHAYPAAHPRKGTLGWLVDQSDWPAVDVLELHVEGVRVVPEAQHRLQGRCRLTPAKLHQHSHRGAAVGDVSEAESVSLAVSQALAAFG